MKRILFFLVLISVFSCQQIDLQYSCDPEINQIVVENLEEFSQIDVFELTVYDLNLQRAIYNCWDYQKKRDAWLEKLNNVIANENLNVDEIQHINSLIQHVVPDYFTSEFQKQNSKNISKFEEEWVTYAKKQLGWTDEFVSYIAYRIYTDKSQFDDELSMIQYLIKTMNSDGESCTCNSEGIYYCPGNTNCNSTSMCSATYGCGWLSTKQCDGLCLY